MYTLMCALLQSAAEHQSLDVVAQLPDVARPVVCTRGIIPRKALCQGLVCSLFREDIAAFDRMTTSALTLGVMLQSAWS